MEKVKLHLANSIKTTLSFWNQRDLPKAMGAARAHWLSLFCCGVVSVCLGQAPPNDNFANAIPLYGNSVTFTGTLANATYEPGESQVVHRFFEGGSVWWSWKATNSTQVVISMVPQNPIGNWCAFAVYSATNVTDITDESQIDWNFFDSGSRRTNRYASFTSTAGTTYYIRALGDPAGVYPNYYPVAPFTLRLAATNSPVILASPQDQIIAESGSAFFSVFAAGLRPLKYQWRFQGHNLTGQTNPCLGLHYLSTDQAGDYSVVVSNSSGAITSAVASLTVFSPTNPPFLVKALGLSDSNRFAFSIKGETGQYFWVWASTDPINWSAEENLLLVQNTNATSVYSIPMLKPQEFLRVSSYVGDPISEVCITHLREIEFAINLWAVETKLEITAPVSETDIAPYLQGDLACPSGGTTFADSYILTDVATRPLCQRFPLTHILP